MINERRSAIAILGIQMVSAFLFAILQVFSGASVVDLSLTLVGGAIATALFIAYLRGWRHATMVATITSTLLVAWFMPEPYVSEEIAFSSLTPVIMAMILLPAYWTPISAGVILVGFLIRSGGQGIYAEPDSFIGFLVVVAGMFVARQVLNNSRQAIEREQQRADQARILAEERAKELAEANTRQEAQIEEQRRLLELVSTLETPVVQIGDGVFFAPLIGSIDSRRAEQVTKRLLDIIHEQRARMVVLDIAGVPTIDTSVARALMRTIQSIRLLGCEVVLSGLSADIAITLTHLGIDLGDITTVRTPQDALSRVSFQRAKTVSLS
jgi:anti-anti-sigma factor